MTSISLLTPAPAVGSTAYVVKLAHPVQFTPGFASVAAAPDPRPPLRSRRGGARETVVPRAPRPSAQAAIAGASSAATATVTAGLRRPGTSSAITAPAPTTAAPVSTAGTRPSTKSWGLSVRARAAEHRGEHGDAENAAHLADGVGRPRGLSRLVGRDRGEHGARRRGEDHRHAAAGEDEGADHRAVGHRRVEDGGEPGEGHGLQRQPERHQRPGPDPVGEDPAIGATSIGIPVHGRVRSPAWSGE